MDHKDCNFENASSVNFEFSLFSGVHIATCSPYLNVDKNVFHYALFNVQSEKRYFALKMLVHFALRVTLY